MTSQWKKLDTWLATHDPAALADLGEPATESELSRLGACLGLPPDPDFLACLRGHDGQRGQASGIFDGYQYLPIRKILMSWEAWRDLLTEGDFDGLAAESDSGVRDTWWSTGWIPFASNGGGDFLCIDMTPAPPGTPGQVIRVFHDMPQRLLLAPGFAQWFDSFVRSKIN